MIAHDSHYQLKNLEPIIDGIFIGINLLDHNDQKTLVLTKDPKTREYIVNNHPYFNPVFIDIDRMLKNFNERDILIKTLVLKSIFDKYKPVVITDLYVNKNNQHIALALANNQGLTILDSSARPIPPYKVKNLVKDQTRNDYLELDLKWVITVYNRLEEVATTKFNRPNHEILDRLDPDPSYKSFDEDLMFEIIWDQIRDELNKEYLINNDLFIELRTILLDDPSFCEIEPEYEDLANEMNMVWEPDSTKE